MDKSLKKLNRAELLELLVALSEEYDDLVDENDRLKKMLMSQRLPRSTKVGSIAEAALQVNGFFEAAQRSADEYLREIKHLRNELATRVDGPSRIAVDSELAVARQNERQAREQWKRIGDELTRTQGELDAARMELKRVQTELERTQAKLKQARSGSDATQVQGQVFRAGRGHGAGAKSSKSNPASTAEIFGRARHSRPAAEGGAS